VLAQNGIVASEVRAQVGGTGNPDSAAQLVAPSLTASVDQLFARLLDTVRSLGDPAQVADQDISTAFRLSLSQQVDATAAPLSQLAAALVPFGTTGPSS